MTPERLLKYHEHCFKLCKEAYEGEVRPHVSDGPIANLQDSTSLWTNPEPCLPDHLDVSDTSDSGDDGIRIVIAP